MPREGKGGLAVLTGGNNSGKSAYLKTTIENLNMLYVGINRFYSFHYINVQQNPEQELQQLYQNHRQQKQQEYSNFEQSFFSPMSAITRLKDKQRSLLFSTFSELFGQAASVASEDPLNEFANRYVSIDGDSLSVTSSGTRLFLGILAALMDDRFSTVAIDEPELGLSPPLQRRLADIIIGARPLKEKLFPHKPNILLSTHSHHFLDKARPSNNWVVEREGNNITARQCSGLAELHDIQFRLLGNDLGSLFLPDVVYFVEGETDKKYLEKVISLHYPKLRVAALACSGEIASRLHSWAVSLGDMATSPYRLRTFVVVDKVKQAGIERACINASLPNENRIDWQHNGIEYYYPRRHLEDIFRADIPNVEDLKVSQDHVSMGETTYTKTELGRMVCERLSKDDDFPAEFTEKLLSPLKKVLE